MNIIIYTYNMRREKETKTIPWFAIPLINQILTPISDQTLIRITAPLSLNSVHSLLKKSNIEIELFFQILFKRTNLLTINFCCALHVGLFSCTFKSQTGWSSFHCPCKSLTGNVLAHPIQKLRRKLWYITPFITIFFFIIIVICVPIYATIRQYTSSDQ